MVRENVSRRDREGITYARRAMIRTRMALSIEGVWKENQLSEKLQLIVVKHRNHFNGDPVDTCEADVDTETESEAEEWTNKCKCHNAYLLWPTLFTGCTYTGECRNNVGHVIS